MNGVINRAVAVAVGSQACKQTDMSLAMEMTEKELQRCEDAVNRIVERLSPVCRQEPAVGSEKTGAPRTGSSAQLPSAILAKAYRLSDLNDRLEGLLQIIEV